MVDNDSFLQDRARGGAASIAGRLGRETQRRRAKRGDVPDEMALASNFSLAYFPMRRALNQGRSALYPA